MAHKSVNIDGFRIGSMVVIRRLGHDNRNRGLCEFRCDCGKIVVRVLNVIIRSVHKSCGCRLPHRVSAGGMSGTRIYGTWHTMIDRCYNTKNKSYRYYGARGITVCEEWKNYLSFKEWVFASGYSDKLTIDRINNDGNYCKENCRWVTRQEQLLNTSRSVYLTIDGKTLNAIEWGALYNIKPHTILDRLRHGHPPEHAVKWVKLDHDKRYKGRKVVDNKTGIVYDSPRKASQAIGVDLVKVKNALGHKTKKWCDVSVI